MVAQKAQCLSSIRNTRLRRIYQPKKGDIILFPSSLFHRTIPFNSDVERCVIAFDLIQKPI